MISNTCNRIHTLVRLVPIYNMTHVQELQQQQARSYCSPWNQVRLSMERFIIVLCASVYVDNTGGNDLPLSKSHDTPYTLYNYHCCNTQLYHYTIICTVCILISIAVYLVNATSSSRSSWQPVAVEIFSHGINYCQNYQSTSAP